jgi:hypothetical protein
MCILDIKTSRVQCFASYGYDSFGLPAEQYIQTGQRPEDTTRVNIDGGYDKEGNKIAGYRKQLDQIGFHSIGIRSTYIKS